MTKGKLLTLCAFFVAVLSCSKKDKQEDPPPPENKNVKAVQDYLATNTELKTFSTSFAKVKLTDADASLGLTVFAPENSAITTYDPNARVTAADLTEAEVKDHIVKGIVKKADLTNGKKLTSLSGKELKIAVDGNDIWVNGALIGDVEEDTNAVVFSIDKVLSAKPGTAEITVYDGTQWTVSDVLGKTVVGAEVALYYSRADFNNDQPAFTGQTDASGKLSFGNLPPGTYYLLAKKGDKLNYFEPADFNGSIIAYQATGIFQTQQEINGAAYLPGTVPGDFKLLDANADGKIDGNDKVNAPYEITISSNKTAKINSLIGYTFNHVAANFQSKADAQALLDNIYTQVGNWQIQQTVLDGILSDNADCTGFQTWCALDNFTFIPANTIITGFWQMAFSNISSLNRIITKLPPLNLPAAEADPLIAQARALRGYINLQLATYFGALPLQQNILPATDMARASLTETYDFIKSDLSAAMDKLPNRWTGADAKRISAHASKLLLARVAVAQNDFAKVKQLTTELKQSAEYQLVNENDVFVNANNDEIIWNINSSIPQQYSAFFTGVATRSFSPVIRYAEILLLSAEATIQTGGTDVTDVNMVYARRGMPTMTFINADQVMGNIRTGWQIEYYREGQRFSKLVKWELAASVLNQQGYRSFNNVLPIPQVMLEQYFNITQNPGY
jgi:uncharacterized surface protein with fasciclin (FAS1) repeats